MSNLWMGIEKLAADIEKKFKSTGVKKFEQTDEYDWYNALYISPTYRRAHIQVVDRRQSHKIYILHATVFPHVSDPSPIWGFDIVAGPNKITGAFCDFSMPGEKGHLLTRWWRNTTDNYNWTKPRELPEWAKAIFSDNMVAAGNITEGKEFDSLIDLAKTSLDFYLDNVGSKSPGADYTDLQNSYCHYQKQNPHVVKSMVAMGVKESTIKKFVQEVQFPELD